MEESTFDPQTFLNTEVAGAMETNYTPVPAGEYTATIDSVTIREVVTERGESKVLDVVHLIHDAETAAKIGMDRLTVRQGIFLDIEPNGNIAIGPNKNVKLGRLREAVGQNGPGPWNFKMLEGAGPLRISVSVGSDRKDPSIPRNNVDKTLPVSPSGAKARATK